MPESPATDAELRSLLVLHRMLGPWPRILGLLLSQFGSAETLARSVTRADFERQGATRALTDFFFGLTRPEPARVDQDLAWLASPRHHLVRLGDAGYPALLAEIHDPPPLLFADGDPGLLATTQLAIVGSRRLSLSGRKTATRLARELAEAGLTITSGLALGIDAAAHRGALEVEDGSTIAVLGCGCDVDYPVTNHQLAAEIRRRGLVVSEFPLGTRAQARFFPQRNRIVTGMSAGTLVVEAALKSGSLISARYAAEQGREVFAVPGSIDGPHHRGCHQLIRDGAKLTGTAGDVLEELPGFSAIAAWDPVPLPTETGTRGILLALLASEPVSVDEIVSNTHLPVSEVLSCLIELEIEGRIVQDRGGFVLDAVSS